MVEVRLYHWPLSEFLKGYSCGDLLALGTTPDEARKTLRDNVDAYLRKSKEYLFRLDGSIDPDEQELYDEVIAEFERDLLVEPEIVTHAFIRGSD